MAPLATLNRLRLPAAAIAILLLGWIVYQTIHAGSDIPPPTSTAVTQLKGGTAGGKRIDGRSWSLDYSTATMSPDGQSIAIDNVRDGLITHDGKPYARMRAAHVIANTASNNFSAQGPVVFTELGGLQRQISTVDASYDGDHRILTLTHPATIREGAATIVVEHATMNFATGETKLGRITGTM